MSKKNKNKNTSDTKAVSKSTSEVITMIKKAMPKKKVIDSLSGYVHPQAETESKDSTISEPKKPKVEVNKVLKSSVKNVVDLPPEHKDYFVYLKNPLEYRRYLLEGSKSILYCLRNYQRLVLIRRTKLEEMQKLKSALKELMYLNKKFNDMLPKYNMAFLMDLPDVVKPKPVEIPKPKIERVVEVPRERNEVDKLEDSLARLEQRLRELK